MQIFKIILVILFPILSWAQNSKIQIMPEVSLFNKTVVKLGDIARFKGVEPEQIEKLKRISLVTSNKKDAELVISASEMSKILRAYLVQAERQTGAKIDVVLPPQIKISIKDLRYSSESVTHQLNAELKKICQECIYEFNVRAPKIDSATVSRWELEVSQIPQGNFSIPMTIFYKNRASTTEWISGRIKVFRYSPVTTRFIRSGDQIQEGDVKLELREGSYQNMRMAKISEVIGKMALKTFRRGEVVGTKQIAEPYVIGFGDPVKIESGSSALKITIDGVAQQRARVGEVIRVKIPRTQKTVNAQVISKKKVELR